MKILRVVSTFVGILVFADTLRAQVALFHEDFESGYANWAMSGFWNPEASTDPCGDMSTGQMGSIFPSGTHCAWYGQDATCNYDSGFANSGALTCLVPITLPATGRVSLRFWNSRFAECDPSLHVDTTQVQISSDGGATWTVGYDFCYWGELGLVYRWHPREFDLTAHQGQTIRIRFWFDTVDDIDNDYLGWFVDDVTVLWNASTVACPAPQVGACPCNNLPAFLAPIACTNSTGRGAELLAGGSASVSSDTLVIHAAHMPPSTNVLFFQGSAETTGNVFGDGRLCVAGPFHRLGTQTASGGEATYPGPGQLAVSVAGLVPPAGGTRAYQAYFRDPAPTFCTSATFNTSSAFELVWSP